MNNTISDYSKSVNPADCRRDRPRARSVVKRLLPEFKILVRYRNLKPLTQAPHIMPIVVVQIVAGVEPHKPLGRNASHWVAGDHSAAGQVLGAVGHAADVQACRIERIGVNVKTTSSFVNQEEIAFPAIVALLLAKAARPFSSRNAMRSAASFSSTTAG
jgi:hypothetical protein